MSRRRGPAFLTLLYWPDMKLTGSAGYKAGGNHERQFTHRPENDCKTPIILRVGAPERSSEYELIAGLRVLMPAAWLSKNRRFRATN